MTRTSLLRAPAAFLVVAGLLASSGRFVTEAAQGEQPAPTYQVDPMWPKPLPNRWIVGAIAGVAVDARDHVWIVHRPGTLQPNETRSIWRAAPPVLEFDAEGNLVSSWGGPGTGYEWPDLEHGIYVDHQDNVWLGGGGEKDAQLLKFTRQGTFLLQIGRKGRNTGSNDTRNLGGAANMVVDAEANELYVADGYVNHRVIVFDATTGAYKRHWGAYGKRPDDALLHAGRGTIAESVQRRGAEREQTQQYDPASPSPQFRIVHAVRIAHDGLVYVCDRTNDRIQVFRKDGTFVAEKFIARQTLGSGSVWDIGFSTDSEQTYLIVPDGTNQQVYVLHRQTLEVVSGFGQGGHWAGQFYGAHNLAIDSKGNLFIGETYEGKRVQKFSYRGMGPAQAPLVQ